VRGAIPPLQYVVMAWYLVKYRDNFTLKFTIFLEFHVIADFLHGSRRLEVLPQSFMIPTAGILACFRFLIDFSFILPHFSITLVM
jgi:hypothetical protein